MRVRVPNTDPDPATQIRIHADPDWHPLTTINKLSKGSVLREIFDKFVQAYRHEFETAGWQVCGGRCFKTCDLPYVSMFTLCVKIEVGEMTFASSLRFSLAPSEQN
jgi:hypothetical protein